jgi:hypothetical protein
LGAGSAGGTEDTDFASAFDAESGEGEGNAEGGDGDGESAEKSSHGKGAIKDAKGFFAKACLGVDQKFPTGAELLAERVAHGLSGDAGLKMNGEAG